MLSLHVDTETSWRGGPNQVLLTVTGLRAAGHRAVIVADPAGELFRRMREGVDLVPLAPRRDRHVGGVVAVEGSQADQARPGARARAACRGTADARAVDCRAASATAFRRLSSHRSLARTTRSAGGVFRSRLLHRQQPGTGAKASGRRRAAVRTEVVHEGVDVERIARLPAANLHADFFLPTRAPIIGTVAPLVPQKGLHHLIDAAALAIRAVPDVRVVIAGDGPLRESLERQIHEHHLERHIFLAGFREDAVEVTKAFDVFAMSSLTEGMCTALVDAMAAARPSVATSVGGIPEVAVDGETAFLVPPRTSRPWRSALSSC